MSVREWENVREDIRCYVIFRPKEEEDEESGGNDDQADVENTVEDGTDDNLDRWQPILGVAFGS